MAQLIQQEQELTNAMLAILRKMPIAGSTDAEIFTRIAVGIINHKEAAPQLYEALKRIVDDLPTKRDWLDPVTESMARAALRAADRKQASK